MDRVKRIWYLSPMRAAKVQASLRIRAVSPEPSLLAHTSSESRGTFRQKTRSLAPLNGWACAVKICHDGMLEDTNSLVAAHMVLFLVCCFCVLVFFFFFVCFGYCCKVPAAHPRPKKLKLPPPPRPRPDLFVTLQYHVLGKPMQRDDSRGIFFRVEVLFACASRCAYLP